MRSRLYFIKIHRSGGGSSAQSWVHHWSWITSDLHVRSCVLVLGVDLWSYSDIGNAIGQWNYELFLESSTKCHILFGDITLYLQVHVIRQSAYDILLGRLFDTLTQSIIRNYADENQTITIHDPNTGKDCHYPDDSLWSSPASLTTSLFLGKID